MTKHYTQEIIVSNSTDAAYRALTKDFNRWWTDDCNSISSVGDLITFNFASTYWTMRVVELEPNTLVEYECIEAHHVHDGLPESILNEWLGTRLKWEITTQGENTKVKLSHIGLIPSLDCYEVCEAGWNYFFVESLKNYLNTGEGSPFKKT